MGGHEQDSELSDDLKLSLFPALAQHTEGYVGCIDRDRRILFLNRSSSRSLPEILSKRLEDFVAPAHRERVVDCVERAFVSGQQDCVEYDVLLEGGAVGYMSTRVVPVLGPRGQELALLLTTNVTERRQLLDELENSREFRRLVLENLPDFVTIVDEEGRFIWVNRLAPTLTREDVIGKKVDAFTSAESVPTSTAAIRAAFESGTIQQYEVEGFGDGQSPAWYLMRAVPIVSEGKVESVLLISSNITERKRTEQALRAAEERLHRTQRLESLGQLAGGIAHDFNNLIQVIAGNISFAKDSLAHGEPATEELDQALRAAERAAHLTSHLLAIGRRKRVDMKRVDLGEVVAHCMRMLRRAIPDDISLVHRPPSEACFAELDAPQFEQVFINLCVNARDAMPNGGELEVWVEPDGAGHVAVRVRDTGLGIAPENLGRVFEPFFTTKGTGSGLGLAVAAGIIAAHGGVIVAESELGRGTTMSIRLPRALTDSAIRRQRPPPSTAGVVLVAEDEDLVRLQLARTLERAGYRVVQAEDGARAVSLFRKHQAEIDVVVLDVIMPELDGWQAFLQITEIAPRIKVLFTTGYAANVLPDDFAARGARLLCKPYSTTALLENISELLGAPTESERS